MTAAEMAKLIGKLGSLRLENLTIQVEVIDVRTRWGYTDVAIKPVHGIGQMWITYDRLQLPL